MSSARKHYKDNFVKVFKFKKIDGLTKGLQNRLQTDDSSEPFEENITGVVRDQDPDYMCLLNFNEVKLGVLVDGLKGCNLCGQPLRLSNCIGKQFFNFYS